MFKSSIINEVLKVVGEDVVIYKEKQAFIHL